MENDTADLLHGYVEIAAFLRLTPDAARAWTRAGLIPTFKMGRVVCARRSSLLKAIEANEASNGKRR